MHLSICNQFDFYFVNSNKEEIKKSIKKSNKIRKFSKKEIKYINTCKQYIQYTRIKKQKEIVNLNLLKLIFGSFCLFSSDIRFVLWEMTKK